MTVPPGYRRLDRLEPQHVAQLHNLYQHEWWTRGRRLDEAHELLGHCDLIVAFEQSATGELVAFARVLTDYLYKALVFDVIVRADHRGLGFGARLIDSICSDDRLRRVRHIELYCRPELVPFYRRWGFTDDLEDVTFMRLARREVGQDDGPGRM